MVPLYCRYGARPIHRQYSGHRHYSALTLPRRQYRAPTLQRDPYQLLITVHTVACSRAYPTVSCRLLRGLPVVGLHDRALRWLVLLGSHRGPLRPIAGDVPGAGLLGVAVNRFRLVNLVSLGCCYPVRGVVLCNVRACTLYSTGSRSTRNLLYTVKT